MGETLKPDFSFQEDAIKNIVNDFIEEPLSKILLIIPTGGGKTLTAIRSIDELVKKGSLSKNDKVMWATHLKQLRKQTKDVLEDEKWNKKFNFHKDLKKILEIRMKTEAIKFLKEDSEGKYKLLIIDEAHHSKATTYQVFFKKKIGILGLTATPTRTDKCVLDFDKISYSITFKDLVKRNVIIKPIFNTFNTGITVYATSLDYSEQEMNKFNSESRNHSIADVIFKNKDKYKKVVIFVGSNKHVKDLYEVINKKNKFFGEPYEHIGYIYSNDNNEKEIKNDDYIKEHKKIKSSILVNCKLLNEGYDDPSLDTVVMAVPTRSMLYYIQCIGRVVRNPKDSENDVYVVEIMDNLPNINYRIDNQWLFADISDYLEPIIREEGCYDINEFKKLVKNIFKKYNVDKNYFKKIPSTHDFDGVSLLLFTPNKRVGEKSKWKPLFFTLENRLKYVNIYNIISNSIRKYYESNHEYMLFEKLKLKRDDEYFGSRPFRVDFLVSLKKAFDEISEKTKVERLIYIIFSKGIKYPEGFLDFIENCHNKEYIKKEFSGLNKNIKYLIKFPLVLGGYEGYFVNESTFEFCKDFISIIRDIKQNERIEDHEKIISENISKLNNVPIPLKYLNSMIYIAKDDVSNFYFNVN